MGHDVTVIRRTPYVTDNNRVTEYRGVHLIDIYAPRRKSLEAIVHTTLAVLKARRLKPDVLHIHAVGPALLMPLARMLGLRTVMTNHGPDYDRAKWGRLAKAVIRMGERLGSRYADRIIVISKVIADIVARNYGRQDTTLIYNGVNTPRKTTETDYITSLGLDRGAYAVALGRFVPEKGFDDLVEAWNRADTAGMRLVIAGDADIPDDYSRRLKEKAHAAGVVLTGFIRGRKLNQLMSHAALFIMPSYHEGLPIALLEALSYGLDTIVSDIPANRLDCLGKNDFFSTGDIDALAAAISRKTAVCGTPRTYDLSPYDWDDIARRTAQVYASLAAR